MFSVTCVASCVACMLIQSSAFLAPSWSSSIGVLPTSHATSPRMKLARPATSGLRMDSGSTSRVDFLRKGALGVGGALGLLGLSTPVSAGFFDKDVIKLEEVPARTVIGKTQSVTWAEVAPVITRMRVDARQHFADTGAQGGRELTSFLNQTPEGADVLVGLEVSDAKGSPAISNGFTAGVVSPPGTYMKDDHSGKPGVAPWFGFMARLTKDGYKFQDQDGGMSMFEVYSGQGGEENVTMYAAVVNPTK